MNKIQISKKKVSEFQGHYWNTFNDFLANSDENELDGIYKKCALIYWYASETANGGISQYFDTKSETNHYEVVDSLMEFNAEEHSKILLESIAINDLYDENKTEDELDILDSKLEELEERYEQCDLDLFTLLENVQKKHESKIIEWID